MFAYIYSLCESESYTHDEEIIENGPQSEALNPHKAESCTMDGNMSDTCT